MSQGNKSNAHGHEQKIKGEGSQKLPTKTVTNVSGDGTFGGSGSKKKGGIKGKGGY